MLTSFALVMSLVAAAPVEPGMLLAYSGTLVPVKDDGNPAIKKFDVSYVVLEREGAGSVGWVLSESGRGGWTWLDHFGVTSAAAGQADSAPALLYERDDGRSIVPIIGPLWLDQHELERGSTWTEGRLDYRVVRETMKADRACWEIEVRSPYGHKRTVWLDRNSPLIVAVRETVFMGQGQEHRLTMELTENKSLAADDMAKIEAGLSGWNRLRETLGVKSRPMRTELTDAQLATLKAELPKLDGSAAGPLAAIARAATSDAQGQKNRAGAVAAMREAILGQPLGKLDLAELGGKTVSNSDVAGKIIVLHFWEYRDSPLEEPYGQTGYLDFLSRRRAGENVVVYGVHVDSRLADDAARRTSVAAARKLKAFMNLGYPILLDDGALLRRLGDPRPAGGKLPLFVVVGKDGKVAEYRAGMYDVKANEGLAELDAAIAKLLNVE